MKILIVDDEHLVRWFLERALNRWGHKVISVSNTTEAMEKLQAENVDILFTDLRMPAENGTSLIKKVSEMPSKPKIVVCSAYITSDMAEEFEKDGIQTLKKPFKLVELESALNRCTA